MFILRQIFKDGQTQNTCLGERYEVTDRRNDEGRFRQLLGRTVTHPDQEKVFAILSYDKGDKIETYPLYEGFSYYIMTESGRTFDNLSFRK